MEVLDKINWFDIVVLILVVRGVYLGAHKGLTAELFNFFGIVTSLILAIHWYSQVADVLIVNFDLPTWLSQFLCFVIIAQIIRVAFKYGLTLLLKLMNLQFMPQLERVGGGIIGFGRGIITSCILVLSLNFVPLHYISESVFERSFSGEFLIKASERTYKSLTFWQPEEKRDKSVFMSISK
ncbi:MAG: CvpA family protein [Candidatus Omnitrophica bacterium]|nr:CvpA family protein [Candidatus Omnitrophota bacterium]